jgi:hypothetical protein
VKVPLSSVKEKRKYPRIQITLPVQFKRSEKFESYPGLTIDASESGILIQTLAEMGIGSKISIELLPSEHCDLTNFKCIGEVMWKDDCPWDDFEGYQYGVKFIKVPDKNLVKLADFFSNPPFSQ